MYGCSYRSNSGEIPPLRPPSPSHISPAAVCVCVCACAADGMYQPVPSRGLTHTHTHTRAGTAGTQAVACDSRTVRRRAGTDAGTERAPRRASHTVRTADQLAGSFRPGDRARSWCASIRPGSTLNWAVSTSPIVLFVKTQCKSDPTCVGVPLPQEPAWTACVRTTGAGQLFFWRAVRALCHKGNMWTCVSQVGVIYDQKGVGGLVSTSLMNILFCTSGGGRICFMSYGLFGGVKSWTENVLLIRYNNNFRDRNRNC